MVARQGSTFVERRKHPRFETPSIIVAFDGRRYRARRWSLGGFEVEDYEGRLSPGALFWVEEIGAGEGGVSPVAVRSRVLRIDPSHRRLIVSFLELDPRAYAILQEVMAERMKLLRDEPSP